MIGKILASISFVLFSAFAAADITKDEREFLDAVSKLENIGDSAGSAQAYVFDKVDEQLWRSLLVLKCPSFKTYRSAQRFSNTVYASALQKAINELNSLAVSPELPGIARSNLSLAWLSAYRQSKLTGDPNTKSYAEEVRQLKYKFLLTPANFSAMYDTVRADGNTGEIRPDSIHRFKKLLVDQLMINEFGSAAKKHGLDAELFAFMSYTKNAFSPQTHDSKLHRDLDAFLSTQSMILMSDAAAQLVASDVRRSLYFFSSPVSINFYTSQAFVPTEESNESVVDVPANLPVRPVDNERILTLLSQRKMVASIEELLADDMPPLGKRLELESMVNSLYAKTAKSICQN